MHLFHSPRFKEQLLQWEIRNKIECMPFTWLKSVLATTALHNLYNKPYNNLWGSNFQNGKKFWSSNSWKVKKMWLIGKLLRTFASDEWALTHSVGPISYLNSTTYNNYNSLTYKALLCLPLSHYARCHFTDNYKLLYVGRIWVQHCNNSQVYRHLYSFLNQKSTNTSFVT